jgi:acetyltransferase
MCAAPQFATERRHGREAAKMEQRDATAVEPAEPGARHLVDLSHHRYLIRPAMEADERSVFEMFSRSSTHDLRMRCLGAIKDFPREAAARLTRCDLAHETALVAVDAEGPQPGEIAGLVHLIDEPGKLGVAEFDIMVRSDLHGHGIGFQLMKEILGCARERALKTVVGYVAGENGAMLWMASELGFALEPMEAGVVRVVAQL